MKKVLFCVHALTSGGAERVVSVWSSKLADVGYDVTVLNYSGAEQEYSLSQNVKRKFIAETREDFLKLNYLKRAIAIRKAIKSTDAEVVISFLPNTQIYVMLFSIGLKIKRIETLRVSPWHIGGRGLFSFLWNLCLKTGDLVILQNEDQKSYYSKRQQKKCVVVPNTVDIKYEKNGKSEYSKTVRNFVAAGRITEQKNYPMMIEAFVKAHEDNPEINLEIYGTGSDEYIAKLENLIKVKDAQEYIRLCGRTNDMQSVMMGKDAFIMSSDYEGMPNPLIEAMTTGLVCISTDCKTGPRDLIKDGKNGFLVPVGNSEELYEKIKRVANLSESEIRTFGEMARKDTIELCGEKNTLNKLIEAIESV